jgi:hypothetical protein
MLGKRPGPLIGKLSELLVSSHHGTGTFNVPTTAGPKTPLDYRIQSHRTMKNYDLGGVGLGIVAALEKSSTNESHAICSNSKMKSNPIPVVSGHQRRVEEEEIESLENYTYVTCHGPNNKSFTQVYYDHSLNQIASSTHEQNQKHKLVISHSHGDSLCENDFPTSDFLSACNLCKKKLHGKDIYMYRGEKAFCSTECRSRQIMIDERKERCRLKASADVVVSSSSSPYNRDQIFSTGILAI